MTKVKLELNKQDLKSILYKYAQEKFNADEPDIDLDNLDGTVSIEYEDFSIEEYGA